MTAWQRYTHTRSSYGSYNIAQCYTTITCAFYRSYSSWKLLTYRTWRAAWSGSKLIVEWCMHEYIMLALWDTFATDLMSTVRHLWGKVHKVMNIKDVFWSVIYNEHVHRVRQWLDTKMRALFEAMRYKTNNVLYASNKVTVYPKLSHSCCLWSDIPNCSNYFITYPLHKYFILF